MSGRAERVLAVWCPDWPVMAAGVPAGTPAAVVHAGRVAACTPAARAEGVRPGLRRRDAQGRCPDLEVLAHDPARDVREFEPVLAALETLTPRLEVTQPGAVTFPCRGAARYHGGEAALAALVAAAVDEVLGERGQCRVGIADGRFAAQLAASHPAQPQPAPGRPVQGLPARGQPSRGAASQIRTSRVTVVPPGETLGFLDGLPVSVLGRPELADLLVRLGLRTVGDVAGVPVAALSERFGAEGVRAHRLATGRDGLPPAPRPPRADLVAEVELDPPAERVDVAAFAARSLAAELHADLGRFGLLVTLARIEVVTGHEERLARTWRADGAFSETTIAERVRWQLDGWLTATAAARPTAGIARLRLTAEEVTPDQGRQLSLWGGPSRDDQRAARALARVEGLLGHDAVAMAALRGGRVPGDRVTLIPHARYAASRAAHPAGSARHDPAAGDPGAAARDPEAPWPGRVPAPAPATVHASPLAAELLDAAGEVVTVSGRGQLSAAPSRLWAGRGPWASITAWAGPWPADERWWDPGQHRRAARMQVVTREGVAHLLALSGGHWWLEATYD